MLSLEHFIHPPELDPLIERLLRGGPGLIVVAGLAAYRGTAEQVDDMAMLVVQVE